MNSFTFIVELRGSGLTEEEAWQDAIDSFADDPGEPQQILQIDEDSDEYEVDDDTDTIEFE